MNKFLFRVRDWIIKKLGGYTESGYERIGK
jgi:hypothetical protein